MAQEAGQIAHSAKNLLCKHEDQSLSTRTVWVSRSEGRVWEELEKGESMIRIYYMKKPFVNNKKTVRHYGMYL